MDRISIGTWKSERGIEMSTGSPASRCGGNRCFLVCGFEILGVVRRRWLSRIPRRAHPASKQESPRKRLDPELNAKRQISVLLFARKRNAVAVGLCDSALAAHAVANTRARRTRDRQRKVRRRPRSFQLESNAVRSAAAVCPFPIAGASGSATTSRIILLSPNDSCHFIDDKYSPYVNKWMWI